jgi:hypothetical protein
MAKTVAERNAEWRRRVVLKANIFDDLNAERAARIRQAFPGDGRPEVRAVIEFFANYPRCQNPPAAIYMGQGGWWVQTQGGLNLFEPAAAIVALSEITSLPVYLVNDIEEVVTPYVQRVRDEVAELRALGLWGQA